MRTFGSFWGVGDAYAPDAPFPTPLATGLKGGIFENHSKTGNHDNDGDDDYNDNNNTDM